MAVKNLYQLKGQNVSKVVIVKSMLQKEPKFFKEWNFKKNDKLGLDIYKMKFASGKIAWWICSKCKSDYLSTIVNRTKGYGCHYCSGRKVNHTNSLAALNPKLSEEWHPTLNGKTTPHDVHFGSSKIVWWKCLICGAAQEQKILLRAKSKKECNRCSGKDLSIGARYPYIVSSWDANKNDDVTPYNIFNDYKKAWWICEKGHSYKSKISERLVRHRCPFCSNNKILIGFNDMWATNPELAKLLNDPEDGYKYTQSSGKKVDWRCPDCNQINKNKTINQIFNYGLSCQYCSDGKSYPEKIMHSILVQLGVEFENEKAFHWLSNKFYDFYLESFNTIIEIHGMQHYKDGFSKTFKGARSLQEEKENDELKKRIALENGIVNYIVIDCSVSNLDFIKNNMEMSNLKNLLELEKVNWNTCQEEACSNLVKDICFYYKNVNQSIKSIIEKFKISDTTIRRYLRRGSQLGWCEYKPDMTNSMPKSVIQLNTDGAFIREWESLRQAARSLNGHGSSISNVARGNSVLAYGFKWVFKEDYYKIN